MVKEIQFALIIIEMRRELDQSQLVANEKTEHGLESQTPVYKVTQFTLPVRT